MPYKLLLLALWLLHWLPPRWLAKISTFLGTLAYFIARERRKITIINLTLCFPEWSAAKVLEVTREHFQLFLTDALTLGLIWFASPTRLSRYIHIEHEEYLNEALKKGPVILLVPHFFGMNTAGIYLTIHHKIVTIYSPLKNKNLDTVIKNIRNRFKTAQVISRHDGIRAIVRRLKDDWSLYYLPDQDFGPANSIFVPFFNIPTATTPALGKLAQITHSQVVPCIVHQDFAHDRCVITFYPAWAQYPTGEAIKDTTQMNQFIEDRVREQPANYLWTHKRFKTRPADTPNFYE